MPWAVCINEFLVQGMGWRTNVGCSLPLPIGLQEAVYEDVPVGTVILMVSATDADSGNFAVIEYSLVDGEGKFAINPTTVSGQRRAWVWDWGVEWAQGHGLRSHEKYGGFPSVSEFYHLEISNLRVLFF